jgi:O-antigen ligase
MIFVVHPSVVFSIFLLISALINFKGDILSEIKNPLAKPLLIYFILTIPSFINTAAPLFSLMDYSNLVALIIVFFVTVLVFTTGGKMMNVLYFFIIAIFLHSIFVDYLGIISNHRDFGLLGVYYIDFAGLGSLLSFIAVLYSKGFKRLIMSLIFIVITVGLILTQTRNAWFSFGFAVFTLLIFLFIKGKSFHVKRYSVIAILFAATLLVIVLIVYTGQLSTKIENRFDLKSQTVVVDEDPNSFGENSLATRALIWHTAVMAFLEHPVIGIGAYSFRYTSGIHYKIPKGFYKLFVQGRTPHVTYLQVITETGIIGLFGFIFLIISVGKFLRKTLKCYHAKEDVERSLMIIWSLIYILFSMFMTESWLYGQYIMWFGILLGFLINNNKLLQINTLEN